MKLYSVLTLLVLSTPVLAQPGFVVTKEPVYEGRRVTVDLPPSQQHRNVGGSDGAGLCVPSSAWHASLWQSVSDIYGFRDWLRRYPGGSYPTKFDSTLKAYCKEKGVPLPLYLQHEGGSVELLELALKTGRAPCVTYCGVDPNYGNQTIAHMLNLVYLDSEYACVLDNNFTSTYLWMPRKEFIARWTGIATNGRPYRIGGMEVGGGWAIIFLDGPPPPYSNKPTTLMEYVQCRNGQCQIMGTASAPIGNPPSDNHEWGRFQDGQWGWVFKKDAPKVEAVPVADYPTGGVVSEKLGREKKFSISGTPCPPSIAFQSLYGANLTDDSLKWNLTVVGDAAFQKTVKETLTRLPAGVAEKLHVKYYSPSDWQVTQFSLPAGVSLRQPSVERVGMQVGVVATADFTLDQLLKLLELINPKPPQPAPQPTPTPDPNSPLPTDPKKSLPWLGIVIIALLVYLLLRKAK